MKYLLAKYYKKSTTTTANILYNGNKFMYLVVNNNDA